jgi:HK97 family phage portal protein
MKVLPGPTGQPRGYEYTVGGRAVRWEFNERTGDCDVRHLRMFNPADDWYGLSPIEPGAYAVDQHNEAMTWIQALLQNSARPSGALVVPGTDGMGDDQFHRLKAEIETTYSGARNAGRPMLLEGGLDWKQMGLSPVDMAILDTKNSAARDIALGLGVPPLLLNIPGDATYSNYQEARLAFWEDTIIQMLEMIGADWSDWFGVDLRPDLDNVPAIADKKATVWDMVEKSTVLTINEKRERMGFEPVAGGEVLLVGMSQIPLSMAIEPPEPAPEPSPLTNDDLKALAYGLERKA